MFLQIRLFGDPTARGSELPELQIGFSARLESSASDIRHQTSHDVIPDFVGGWAFGDAIGVGLYSVDGWWTVVSLVVDASLSEVCHFLSKLMCTRT